MCLSKYFKCCFSNKDKDIDQIEKDAKGIDLRVFSKSKLKMQSMVPEINENKDPGYDIGIPEDMIDVTLYDVDKVKPFTMQDLQLKCYVSQVYDADTCTLIVPFYGRPFEVKCRLSGIDSAEIRSKDQEEKLYAIEARDYLRNLILYNTVWVNCGKMDKYGRLLGDIYMNKEDMLKHQHCISDHLIDVKYAYVYSGGKKIPYQTWSKR